MKGANQASKKTQKAKWVDRTPFLLRHSEVPLDCVQVLDVKPVLCLEKNEIKCLGLTSEKEGPIFKSPL